MEFTVLLELGVEDLPPLMVKDALSQLKEKSRLLFEKHSISYGKIATRGSSRRLVLWVERVASKQKDIVEKEAGPPKFVVFDSKGNLTEAGKKYLQAKKVEIEDIEVQKSQKGEYVYIKKYRRGKETINILPLIFTELILSLHFSKSMRWKDNSFYFGRPLRYILALAGDELVEFEIAGISSDRKTRGHRYLHPGWIEIPNTSSYPEIMKRSRVILDVEERKKRINNQMLKLTHRLREKNCKAEVIPDEDLLEELSYLAEYPTVFCGGFDSHYLSLPSFVLKACLRDYQQNFTVSDGNKILPFFIGIRDGGKANLNQIVEGNKRVLHARLEDAQFFYEEDKKTSLEEKVPLLKQIIVQEKLGSYYDKIKRLVKLTKKLSSQLGISDNVGKKIQRAAYLCKADLVTNMVREFPELQGMMGGVYATCSGEDPLVAKIIEEHRKPRFNGDDPPQTLEGSLLAIADKIDTLTGAFWADFIPSGSEDPWGLRREAQGVIEIILSKELHISIVRLIDESMSLYGDNAIAKQKLIDFFKTRMIYLLKEKGISYDKINAVIRMGVDDPVNTLKRAKALQKIALREKFREEVVAIVRLLNILKQANEWGINIPSQPKEDKLVEGEEKNLYQKWRKIKESIDRSLDKADYVQAYNRLSVLKDSIHNFFDKVLVMSEDVNLKLNRLALLREIGSRFLKIADFTELQVK
ncbi:glycine--tRNA ligase subunit beta [Candidatus Aerophobetes bacterium]|uniref:Glycine--tRNA ligase beta subunit n=2 Tax=Aerophobetes bacterium TaxID=2030807 RepID=A0A662DIT0_UNCAE|nr:MAG: glycine--tRNA ligase subunit beta [Candidatus Aerophobetes bacterium]